MAIYQNELPMANDKSTEEPVSNVDGDNVYYRFGGAAICTMLKHRYKEIRRCSSATRNALSIEICKYCNVSSVVAASAGGGSW